MKVRYDPRKELVIHEMVCYPTVEEYVINLTLGVNGPFPPLHWVNGVLMNFSTMEQTESIVKDLIQGVLHWSYVSCAPLPKYQLSIDIPNRPGTFLTILDSSNNSIFTDISKFLKKELKNTKK